MLVTYIISFCLLCCVVQDDGRCESHFSEEGACKDTLSVLGLPLCYWKPVSSQCHYMPPLAIGYWSNYQTTSSKWSGDRDYDRIEEQQEINEHRRFSAYLYDILQNFHSVVYIMVISWVALLLTRIMTMSFERLFREKVYNSYLSWHKYAQFLNKKFGDDAEPSLASKSASCFHACFIKPCWVRFRYYFLDCKWLLAPNEKLDHKGRPRVRHHRHIRLPQEEEAGPSVPVPSLDRPGEYQEYAEHDLKRTRDPSKGMSVGGVGWIRQLTQYQDLVQLQKDQKELQDKQKNVINNIDRLRKPHVTLQAPPPRAEGPGIDGGRSAKTTLNKKGETSLHDHNNFSVDTILENSEFNTRMQEEHSGPKSPPYVVNAGKGSLAAARPGSPSGKRANVENLLPSSSPPRLDPNYHGGSKYHNQLELYATPTNAPTEKDYPFREGIRNMANSAAEEINLAFGAIQDQYREFRESRPNTTQVYRNRYWNNGLSSSRPGTVNRGPGSPNKTSEFGDGDGPGSVPVQVFSAIQANIMSAVKASANTNDDYYTLNQEYEDLMIQASELVKRPRMSEEAATTVAYAKQMLGLNDKGETLNAATATNHRSNSLWCCCCVVGQCIGGYLGVGYGGLYYPSTTTDPTSASTHSTETAPSKGSIMRNLQFSRVDSKRIFHRIYGLNNPMKNMFLLENFLLSEHPVTRYAAGNGAYLLGLDTIPPNVVSLVEYVFWAIFTVGLLFLLPLYFVWFYINTLTLKTNINDIIIVAGTAYILQTAVISPLFLYWFRVVVATAVDTELSHIHVNIRNRARTVFERKYGFFGRDLFHNNTVKSPNHALTRTSKSARVNLHNICCITDHYNPTCRVAKAYTGLIMFRLVLELNDYDINRRMHYILKRKHETEGYIKGMGMAARDGTGTKSKSGKTAGSYLDLMKNAVASMVPQSQLMLGDEEGSGKSTSGRVRRSVRQSRKRSAKIGVIPEGDEDAATVEDGRGDVEMTTEGLYSEGGDQEMQHEGGEVALTVGDDIELGLGGNGESEREVYEPEEGEEGYANPAAASITGPNQKRVVHDAHLLYKDDLPEDPNASFDARGFKAVPSARNLRLQMGERSVVASFLDGSSVGVTSTTSGEPVHLAPWKVAYEAVAGTVAVAKEVCDEGCSRCYGYVPTCCFSLLGAILAGLIFLGGLCAKGCKFLGTCIAGCIDAVWVEVLLRVLTTRSEKPCSRSGAYRCFQRCLNSILTPIFECCYYKSTYTHSLVFGEGNIEWEYYFDRIQHSCALVAARIALTTFPVIGMGDVVFESLFTLLLFGFMTLCWYVLLSDRTPAAGVPLETESWIAVNFKMVMRPILLYALPTIAILMVLRAELRRRSFNFANKNLADPVSPFENIYPRVVEYLSKLEDLQGNGAEALLSKRLLLEHADTDDILNENHNRRLDGRRGGIVSNLNFNSGANLASKNFHGASMMGKNGIIEQAFSPDGPNGEGAPVMGKRDGGEEGENAGGEDEGPATESMDRGLRSETNLLQPNGYSTLDKDYLARKKGFFSSMKFLSLDSQSDSSDEGGPAAGSDEEGKRDKTTDDITKTHTLANSFQSSGLYGQSRRDLVDRVEAEANLFPQGKKDPSGYFYIAGDKKKKKKLDQQEEDIQQYMSQLSLVSKHTVKSYLKTNAEAAAAAASPNKASAEVDPALISGDESGTGSASGTGSPKKKKKKKKRPQQVTYCD